MSLDTPCNRETTLCLALSTRYSKSSAEMVDFDHVSSDDREKWLVN